MEIPVIFVNKKYQLHWTHPVFETDFKCTVCGKKVKAWMTLVPTTGIRRFSCEHCHTQFCLQFKRDHCPGCKWRTVDCLTIQILYTNLKLPKPKDEGSQTKEV